MRKKKTSMLLVSAQLYRIVTSKVIFLLVIGLQWGEANGADFASVSLGYNNWWTFEDKDGKHSMASQAIDALATRGFAVVTANGNG